MKRLTCFLLIFLLVISIFSSCNRAENLQFSSATHEGKTKQTTSAKTETTTEMQTQEETSEVATMLDKSYLGAWYTDKYKLDDLVISEIYSDRIAFFISFYRTASFAAIAKIVDDEIVFHDYGELISGRLEFNNDNITVYIDNSDFIYKKAGSTYVYPLKHKLTITEPKIETLKSKFEYLLASRITFDDFKNAYPDYKIVEEYPDIVNVQSDSLPGVEFHFMIKNFESYYHLSVITATAKELLPEYIGIEKDKLPAYPFEENDEFIVLSDINFAFGVSFGDTGYNYLHEDIPVSMSIR